MVLQKYFANSIAKIGRAHNSGRIWLQGKDPEKSGFVPGQTYEVLVKEGERLISLVVKKDGARVVSRKILSSGRTTPVIDINSKTLMSIFSGMEAVRVVFAEGSIHILPIASEIRRISRLNRLRERILGGKPIATGSIAHGGGVLSHAVHSGLAESGIPSKLAFACEIREELLEHAAEHNEVWDTQTLAIAAPVQEAAFDKWFMDKLPEVDILEMGIPCSGASVAGRSKLKTPMAEAHEEVGHLIAGTIAMIARANPAVILFENVPTYANSASGYILRHQLRDFGYDIHETELSGEDFNCLEARKRWCLVGVSKGMPFDMSYLEKPERIERKLSEILEDIPADSSMWSQMEGLKKKQDRDAQKGNSFAMQVVTAESTKMPTLTKGIAKNRSTDPKVQHPENPDLLRLPTPREHARCKGIPEHLVEGLSNTRAHEVLGQSVLYAPFQTVGKLIGKFLKSFALGIENAGCVELARAAA